MLGPLRRGVLIRADLSKLLLGCLVRFPMNQPRSTDPKPNSPALDATIYQVVNLLGPTAGATTRTCTLCTCSLQLKVGI